MASKEPEEPSNTVTEEETIAFRKKRARRVSFADVEITSVHIFNRDEEYDTPPDPQPSSVIAPDNEVLGLFRDLVDSDDSRESSPNLDDDGEVVEPRKTFLRPLGSPSPMSSIAGSATSNDEDNFFGPVSASFIRPGQLSDSAASDDNHDVTMDSTAFSMHFRSLARSDSGGEMKTPTAFRLAFEDKTPTADTTPSNPDSLMVLTNTKKQISQRLEPGSIVCDSKDSNDMSIVGENPRRYDYGILSPTLDALLNEGGNDLYAVSFSENTSMGNNASATDQIGCDHLDENVDKDAEMENGSKDTDNGGLDKPEIEGEATVTNSRTPADVNGKVLPLDVFEHENLNDSQAKENLSRDRINKYHIDQNSNPQYESPLKRSTLALSAERHTPFQSRLVGPMSLDSKQRYYAVSKESNKYDDGMSSIQKDISKFSIPAPSPCASSIKEGSNKLRRRLSSYPSMTNANNVLPESGSSQQIKSLDIPAAHFGGWLFTNDLKNREDGSSTTFETQGIQTPQHSNLSQNEKTSGPVNVGDSPLVVPLISFSKEKPPRSFMEADSPTQVTLSVKRKAKSDFLMSENPIEGRSVTIGIDILSVDGGVGSCNDGQLASSPVKCLNNRLVASTRSPVSLFGEMKQRDPNGESSSTVSGQDGDATGPTEKVDKGETCLPYQQNKLGISTSFQTSSKDRDILNFQFGSPHKSLKVGAESPQIISIARRRVDMSCQKSPSIAIQSLTWKEPTQSPSEGEVIQSLTRKESTQSPLGKIPTEIFMSKESTQSPSKKEVVKSLTRKESTQTPSKREAVQSLTRKESTESPSKIEVVPSLRRKESTQSPFGKSPTGVSMSMESTRSLSNKEPTQGPAREESIDNCSNRELFDVSQDDMMRCYMERSQLPSKSKLSEYGNDNSHQDHQTTQSSVLDFGNLSGRKRKNIGIGPPDRDYEDKIERSSKACKSGSSSSDFVLEQANRGNNELMEIAGDTDKTWKHWTDVAIKFSADTVDMLPQVVNELSLRQIDQLEDILVHLSSIKKYVVLSSEIHSQKTAEHFSLRHKRVVEARLLMCKLVYEKARLQLLRVKQKGYLKRKELLSSQIQDFQMLKSHYFRLCESVRRHTQAGDSNSQSSSVVSEVKEESNDRVITLRKKFESLDSKIKRLSQSFSTSCKLKEVSSSTEIVAFVRGHLKKRQHCRVLRQDLQLWEIDDFERTNDHYSILLNYQGYISQRYTIKAGRVLSIIVSNKFDDITISKNFPHMNVKIAFSFVFDVQTTKKCVGSRYLSQETQIISSLLHNLLDVIEEVQLAKIEIGNLMQTSFHSPSDEQLYLQLNFIEFQTSRKLTMTLDVSDLNRGVYPSEILPLKIEVSNSQRQSSLVTDITTAAQSLRAGYSWILRLCKCVSQVLQA